MKFLCLLFGHKEIWRAGKCSTEFATFWIPVCRRCNKVLTPLDEYTASRVLPVLEAHQPGEFVSLNSKEK